ncbi:MAG TPA: hypothetical protein VFI43_03150 [Nitrosospira sp.]|nr:hypothetical protein [Nitrosospira sp.]
MIKYGGCVWGHLEAHDFFSLGPAAVIETIAIFRFKAGRGWFSA